MGQAPKVKSPSAVRSLAGSPGVAQLAEAEGGDEDAEGEEDVEDEAEVGDKGEGYDDWDAYEQEV